MSRMRTGSMAGRSGGEIGFPQPRLIKLMLYIFRFIQTKGDRRRHPFFTLGSVFFLITMGLLIPCEAAFASPISDKYRDLGGSGGFLGAPKNVESTNFDSIGRHQHYQNGSIYWHPDTGAHEVRGLIHQKWEALGWETGYLGYPMTDEIDTFTGAGKVSKFQGGELIWRRATNEVSEVRSTDLVVDLPFPAGETWKIVQANAVARNDSHSGPWAYCWDFMLAGKPQAQSNGRPFTASANTTIVYVEQNNDSGGNESNVVVQQLGEGRYASYLHIKKGSYAKHFAGGSDINLRPQDAPWARRPKSKTGMVLAEVGDTGAAVGAYHLHFCVTTKPDRDQFRPFESVPVAFRNYSFSTDSGATWKYSRIGIPKKDQWVRAEPHSSERAPEVNASAKVLDYGTVRGRVFFPSNAGKPIGPGKLMITIGSSWGEPLTGTIVNLSGKELNDQWSYEINNVPSFGDLLVAVSYNWSSGTAHGSIHGRSGSFELKPNTTVTQDVHLETETYPGKTRR